MASKVLVADDSATIQKIVAMAFENDDVEVKGVTSGKQALEELEVFGPDIVLADVDMPGISGFELSRKIKTTAATQNIKVILLTSDFEEFDEAEFEKSGAEDHIAKPFKSEEIVVKVHDLLSGKTPVKTLPVEEAADPAPAPESEPTAELSADDLIDELLDEEPAAPVVELDAEDIEVEPEATEPVVELSAEDMEEETEAAPAVMELNAEDMEEEASPPMMELSAEDLEEIANTPEPEVEPYDLTVDDEAEFDETHMPDAAAVSESSNGGNPVAEEVPEITDEEDPEFVLGEKRRTNEPEDSLEEAFRSVSGREEKERVEVVPEPASANNTSKPDLIRDAQAFMAEHDAAPKSTSAAADAPGRATSFESKLDAVTSDHALRLLEASLDRNVKKEIAGLSDTIMKTVREVVQQVAPEIVRTVIREEIEQIRKSNND